ncbi:hypothetical protein FRX31_010974 [Thalictrum thalictroides]|uniref:GPI-anchored protein LLG1-like domain-containing protein n=1 Tax=Thalictrum thalictroides TaxID=46969 RepID=A0A7J6WQ06_THATH|nr:hypothetical protein FRX31_010974 [Thalictrum thalictroides]
MLSMKFACPFKDHHVNDASGTCTDIMLDSITQAGNYPPNLFSNECLLQEDRQGLECDVDAPGEAVSSDSKTEASKLYHLTLKLRRQPYLGNFYWLCFLFLF